MAMPSQTHQNDFAEQYSSSNTQHIYVVHNDAKWIVDSKNTKQDYHIIYAEKVRF